MFSKRRITIALIPLLATIATGTMGYMLIEGYTAFDGLYMTIITIMTVGYNEVRPLSGAGRAFTIVLILMGFASLAFAGNILIESLVQNIWSGRSERKNMKKKITELKSHYIICGFGRVGATAAELLKMEGAGFVIIEKNPDHCQDIREKGYIFLQADATTEEALMDAGIKRARGLVALLNSDPENLFIVLTARELNPTLQIISRAEDVSSEKKILRAGADKVVSPFITAGRQIARDILLSTGKELDLDESCECQEASSQLITLAKDNSLIGKSIKTASKEIGRDIIGLRRKAIDSIYPDPETILEEGDTLLTLGVSQKKQGIERRSSEIPKIVIVDNNQVILGLYTRLFQKAGFNPLCATTGKQGLELILKEKPAAAVIDYTLPVISGIDICREIRKSKEHDGVKLILFTEDNAPETRKRAMENGAHAVVVKNADASEVVETVIQCLREKH